MVKVGVEYRDTGNLSPVCHHVRYDSFAGKQYNLENNISWKKSVRKALEVQRS